MHEGNVASVVAKAQGSRQLRWLLSFPVYWFHLNGSRDDALLMLQMYGVRYLLFPFLKGFLFQIAVTDTRALSFLPAQSFHSSFSLLTFNDT